GGKHFGDSVLPVRRHTIAAAPGGVWSWDAYSDPAHAFDSQGNLYYTALGFDFAQDGYDGLFVWKANSCLRGSALAAPGSGTCAPFSPPIDTNGTAVRSNFDNPALSDDKEMMAADTSASSPYKDNVYITWTIFDFSCTGGSYCDSPNYFSKSSDGGTTWSDPVRVGRDYALQPYSVPGNEITDCALFRQCLPPNGYRTDDYPSMGIDSTTGKLAAYWPDFRNGGPCATDPATSLPVLPCDNMNNDIIAATSTDGGA